MKRVFIILIVCTVSCNYVYAQMTISRDSLTSFIRSDLNLILQDKSYTRIPSAEFDNIMVEKISSAIDDKFRNLYWYVGVVGAILGALLFYSGNRFLKESVQKKFTDEYESMRKRMLKEIDKKVEDIQNEMESRMKEIGSKLVADAKKDIFRMRVDKIESEVTSGRVTQETFQLVKNSFIEFGDLFDDSEKAKIISLLSNASYSLKRESEMDKVVQSYMANDNIKMDASIFINLASGFFYAYYSTQDSNDKTKCIFYINESLRKLENYGEAYGLKLELLMMDYSNATNDTDRQNILEQAKNIIKLCKSSAASTAEIKARFSRVSPTPIEGGYIQMLRNKLPAETAGI